MDKLILTDVDDVLLDWRGAALQHIIRHTDFHERNVPEIFANLRQIIDDARIVEEGYPEAACVTGFNSSSFFSSLQPHLDALSIVPELARRGWRFVAISAAGETSAHLNRRRKNLEAAFGPIFEDVILVPLYGSKREVLSQYKPSVWVEDNPENASDGADIGHKSFLFVDRRYPETPDPRVQHVTSWAEIAARVGEQDIFGMGRAAA